MLLLKIKFYSYLVENGQKATINFYFKSRFSVKPIKFQIYFAHDCGYKRPIQFSSVRKISQPIEKYLQKSCWELWKILIKRREIYSKRDFQIFSDNGKTLNFVEKLPQDWKDAIVILFNKKKGKNSLPATIDQFYWLLLFWALEWSIKDAIFTSATEKNFFNNLHRGFFVERHY